MLHLPHGLTTTLAAGRTLCSGAAAISLGDALWPKAASLAARLRALEQVVVLSCSRGAGPTLRVLDYLASVHESGLRKLPLHDFQDLLAKHGAAWPSHVALHPHLTGFGSGKIGRASCRERV